MRRKPDLERKHSCPRSAGDVFIGVVFQHRRASRVKSIEQTAINMVMDVTDR